MFQNSDRWAFGPEKPDPCLSALVRSHKSAHKSETTNISVINTVSLNTTSCLLVIPMDEARNTPETHRWILPTCIHARASHIRYSYFHYSSILYLHYVKPNIFHATSHQLLLISYLITSHQYIHLPKPCKFNLKYNYNREKAQQGCNIRQKCFQLFGVQWMFTFAAGDVRGIGICTFLALRLVLL